jgi:hypothetical protein
MPEQFVLEQAFQNVMVTILGLGAVLGYFLNILLLLKETSKFLEQVCTSFMFLTFYTFASV